MKCNHCNCCNQAGPITVTVGPVPPGWKCSLKSESEKLEPLAAFKPGSGRFGWMVSPVAVITTEGQTEMDNRHKIVNAIQNRKERLLSLEVARKSLEIADRNAVNADLEVARQIKNTYGLGKPVVFESEIFTVHECDDHQTGKFSLTVVPTNFEILSFPNK